MLASMRTLGTHLFQITLLAQIVEVTGPVEVFAEAQALRGPDALAGYYNRSLSLLESNLWDGNLETTWLLVGRGQPGLTCEGYAGVLRTVTTHSGVALSLVGIY